MRSDAISLRANRANSDSGCFLARVPGAGPCDGRLVKCHLIPRQTLRFEFGKTLGNKLAAEPETWVPGCSGPTGVGGHHGRLDSGGCNPLRIPRAMLPREFVEWCEGKGLGWYVDRAYGPLEVAA